MWGAQVSVHCILVDVVLWKKRFTFFLLWMTLTWALFSVAQYSQHHMMPPYGTPVPYPAMYPPGAVYAHPSMPMVFFIPLTPIQVIVYGFLCSVAGQMIKLKTYFARHSFCCSLQLLVQPTRKLSRTKLLARSQRGIWKERETEVRKCLLVQGTMVYLKGATYKACSMCLLLQIDSSRRIRSSWGSFDVIMITSFCSDESVTAGSSDENDENANHQVLIWAWRVSLLV